MTALVREHIHMLHVLCMCVCLTYCKAQWQTGHMLQKSTLWCVTLHCGCSLNVAESKQSGNRRLTLCGVLLCGCGCVCVFFFSSTDEMVTGFYCFHPCPNLLAMCESSGQI